MKNRHYLLIAIMTGWLSYFVFPIEEPTIAYFLGVIIGVLSLFYIPYEKYTHNIVIQAILWTALLFVFPIYIVAGLTVGVFTHIGLDLYREKIQLTIVRQRFLTLGLLFINFLTVSGVGLIKFLNF